jgi:hypothetical protein
MTSPARISANIENAKKSTGARTQAGKNRSRMNAVKHGMTARIVLLAHESVDEFRSQAKGWFDVLQPRDRLELTMAERAVYASWQLNRLVRARSAQVCLKAHTRAEDERARRKLEVTELGMELLRAPKGQAAVSPFAEPASDGNKSEKARTSEEAAHPVMLVLRLSSSLAGCKWLLARWQELKETLEQQLDWGAPERFRLFRLLGIRAADAILTLELTSLLQMCEMLDPQARSIVEELWEGVVSPTELASVEATYRKRASILPAVDQDSARQNLLSVVERERAKLEEQAEQHKGREELVALLEEHSASIDNSREGQLRDRYENSSERLMLRYIDEINKRHAEATKRGEPASSVYYSPSRDWCAPLYPSIDSGDQHDCDDRTAECGDVDGAENDGAASCAALPVAEPAVERSATDARPLRNEPNEAPATTTSVLRNEPNAAGAAAGVLRNEPNDGVPRAASVLRNEPNDGVPWAASVLRNEPNGVPATIPAGTRPDEGHGNAVIESRRKRKLRERNQRNAERAAEARAKAAARRK